MSYELPQNIEAERFAIRACMVSRDALSMASRRMRPTMFFDGRHEVIFNHILEIEKREARPSVETLIHSLKRKGQLEAAGSAEYVREIHGLRSIPTNIEVYADSIVETAFRRSHIEAGERIIARALQGQDEMEALQDKAEREILDASSSVGSSNLIHISEAANEAKAQAEAAKESDGITGIPTGIDSFDNLLGGLQDTDLIIIAARPGMGKTGFATGSQVKAAEKGYGSVTQTLEMPAAQYALRQMGQSQRLNTQKVRLGRVTDDDMQSVSAGFEKLGSLPIWLDDTPGVSLQQVRTNARKAVKEHGADALWVDYLQLMEGMSGDSREQEVSSISRGLKQLAKELSIPVVALAQLNRKCEDRHDKRPRLSDLRESGSLEQDADVVVFLYRDQYYGIDRDEEGHKTAGTAEIIVAKQRNGPVGTVRAAFVEQYAMFENLDTRRQAPRKQTAKDYIAPVPQDNGAPF